MTAAKVGKLKKGRLNKMQYFCGALVDCLQTSSNSIQHKKISIIIFDFEKTL